MQQESPTMPIASQWRIDLARRIAPHYAAYSNVDAVVVLGGVARGWADSYSDIDLVVYWREPPAEAERRAVMQTRNAHPGQFGDTLTSQSDSHLRYWWEDFYLAGDENTGIKIDVGHYLTADMDAVIESVTHQYDKHPLKHEMLYSIKRVLAFYGEALIERWKQAVGRCPEPLARQMVEKNLHLPPFWIAEACAVRGDWLDYARTMQEVCRRLLMAAVYLNREYFPGAKRQAHLLAELAFQPEDFHARLNHILRGDAVEVIPAAYRLYDEIHALAEQHMPDADLTGAHETFFHRRVRWDSPPDGLL